MPLQTTIDAAIYSNERNLSTLVICTKCGNSESDGSVFCGACGAKLPSVSTPKREQVYAGKVHKCPSCGMELRSFTAFCPGCGHEINSASVLTSIKDFAAQINNFDVLIANSPKAPKAGWKSWRKGARFWWVVLNIFTFCIPLVIYLILPALGIGRTSAMTPLENKKANFITNYVFPNDRENIIEGLFYFKSQTSSLVAGKINRNAVQWMKTWRIKATQLYDRAELMFRGDPLVREAYSGILANEKKVKRTLILRAVFALLFAVLYIGLIYFGCCRSCSSSETTSNAKEWPSSGLALMLPAPETNNWKITENSYNVISVEIKKSSQQMYLNYIANCKAYGFTVDSLQDEDSYVANNAEDYEVSLKYNKYSETIDIDLIKYPVVHWPDSGLALKLPNPELKYGELLFNSSDSLKIVLYRSSEETFSSYVEACKDKGFVVDEFLGDHSFDAYNEEGDKLSLYCYNNIIRIHLDAAMQMGEIKWPKSTLTNRIPQPVSNYGKIDSESSDYFIVYIGNTILQDYSDYVDLCFDSGFNVDYYRDDDSFRAYDPDGYKLEVEYKGFNTMMIKIHKPEQP